jgi:hypothetical protein
MFMSQYLLGLGQDTAGPIPASRYRQIVYITKTVTAVNAAPGATPQH